MQKKRPIQNAQIGSHDLKQSPVYVNSSTIAARYGVTSRYILQLAADGVIPCLRLGKQCVRFNPDAVAEALENQN